VPVLEGFSRFLAAQGIASSIERKVLMRLEENTAWQGDYHPMLSERVAAARHMSTSNHIGEDPDASVLTLLDDLDELDSALLVEAIGKERAKRLTFVSWEEALTKAYLPMWTQAVCTYAPGLAGVTPESLPDTVRNLSLFGMELLSKSNRAEQFDSLSKSVSTTLGSALALALHRAGWELHVSPGEPVYAQCGATRIEPFSILARLLTHRLSAEEWRKQCTQAGIAGLDFGKLSEV
jgi:hypothetical protein